MESRKRLEIDVLKGLSALSGEGLLWEIATESDFPSIVTGQALRDAESQGFVSYDPEEGVWYLTRLGMDQIAQLGP